MPTEEKSTPFLDRQISILMKEWEVAEAGIARYDTILNTIRTWAVTVFAAMLAASATRWYIIWFALVPTVLLLIVEGLNKALQQYFIGRSADIQEYLSSAQFKEDCTRGELTFLTPGIAQKFADTSLRSYYQSSFAALKNPAVYPLYLCIVAASAFVGTVLTIVHFCYRWAETQQL